MSFRRCAHVEPLESRQLFASVAIDTSFGTSSGKTITDLGGNYDWANGMLVQPDGKILVTGNGSASDMIYAAVRYNPNGTLDTTFSGDGKLQLDNTYGWPGGVALQPDGKILLSGDLWDPVDEVEKMVIFRLNANGSLDTSFG